MHYKNGRIAQNGDKVVQVVKGQIPVAGILYDAIAGNDACNGRIAVTSPNDPYACLYNVLHADDVAAAIIGDSTFPAKDTIYANPPASDGSPRVGGDTTA